MEQCCSNFTAVLLVERILFACISPESLVHLFFKGHIVHKGKWRILKNAAEKNLTVPQRQSAKQEYVTSRG